MVFDRPFAGAKRISWKSKLACLLWKQRELMRLFFVVARGLRDQEDTRAHNLIRIMLSLFRSDIYLEERLMDVSVM